MVDPEAFLDDHVRMLSEGELVDDDMIRGACPAQVAIPWLPGMLGCRMRILPENVMGEERHLTLGRSAPHTPRSQHPWFRKYIDFAEALVRAAATAAFPSAIPPRSAPLTCSPCFRGHTESILDLRTSPKNPPALCRLGEIFRDVTEEIWRRVPLLAGGYFDAQYSLWAPGPIIRMQEDATAVYSPALYRSSCSQSTADRGHFPTAFIHLHSTSMFLLDAFLEIDEIRCFEVNNDALGPPVAAMVPYYRRVQEAKKPLLIRGSFNTEEMRLLMDSLEPRGLFLNMMVTRMEEIEALRPLVGM